MNKNYSIILKAIAAVSAATCCGLGGVCLYGHIDEKRRKQKMELVLLKETVRQLFYDVNELKYHIQFQEKK